MANNSQSRKWLLTINNPLECGLDRDKIIQSLNAFFPEYYCLADEIATTGTPHTHVFLYRKSAIRFNTIKKVFPIAHIEKSYGSVVENRDYIAKQGKWANSDKAETSVVGSFYESGTPPSEKEEKSPQMYELIQNINDGMTTLDIIKNTPGMAFRIRDIDIIRQTILAEKYTNEYREVEVCYLFGVSGAGKTMHIFQKYQGREICRVTNYRSGYNISFDGYNGQDVLVFEEFNSQIPITNMLNYLDIYPLLLPARYSDRIACFTKVYITSNLPLNQQYRDAQLNTPEIWKAFFRRIHRITEFFANGKTLELKEEMLCTKQEKD